MLVAAYTPGTAPFAAGQAAFTVMIVVLFNLLVPAGWKVGLLRVEDVGIGCAVSLSSASCSGPAASPPSSATTWRMPSAVARATSAMRPAGRSAIGPGGRSAAEVAVAAGNRLDDALRGYLTEQGSKRLSKADLWALVMAATRLRLTAHSMASLPRTPHAHADDGGLHAALRRQMADLSGFYERLAAEVGRPGARRARHRSRSRCRPAGSPAPPCHRAGPDPPTGLTGCGSATSSTTCEAHAADITGPAVRLAAIRRRPWWR